MSRSVLFVLAVLALLASVSAQSSSSSSTGSSWYSRLSSSSSSLVAAASTGSSVPVTPGSPDAYPSGSYSLAFQATFATAITADNAAETAVLVGEDIAYNLANATGANSTVVEQFVVVTSIAGIKLAPASRRLLQNTPSSVTFVLLGNITNVVSSFSPSAAVTQFVAAAEAGTLSAPNSGAMIPAQNITNVVAVGSTPSSSSTGLGDNGAASVSVSAVLLFAGAAALALLL